MRLLFFYYYSSYLLQPFYFMMMKIVANIFLEKLDQHFTRKVWDNML
jgi:hypothetical protein